MCTVFYYFAVPEVTGQSLEDVESTATGGKGKGASMHYANGCENTNQWPKSPSEDLTEKLLVVDC